MWNQTGKVNVLKQNRNSCELAPLVIKIFICKDMVQSMSGLKLAHVISFPLIMSLSVKWETPGFLARRTNERTEGVDLHRGLQTPQTLLL